MQQYAANVLDAQTACHIGGQEPGRQGPAQERLDLAVEAADAELLRWKKESGLTGQANE